ncbi:MAG TPA: hypothetical protein VF705_11275 [Longimicrobium sp.]
MNIPPRIQRLIEARDMELVAPDPDVVSGLWEKAVASNEDSRKGLSPDNAITLAYQAGFQACTALLEAHGYRAKGANPGHHYRVFYATAGLGYPALKDVDAASESVRKGRTKSFYTGGVQGAEQVEALHGWLDGLLPAVYGALSEVAPELHARLRRP